MELKRKSRFQTQTQDSNQKDDLGREAKNIGDLESKKIHTLKIKSGKVGKFHFKIL